MKTLKSFFFGIFAVCSLLFTVSCEKQTALTTETTSIETQSGKLAPDSFLPTTGYVYVKSPTITMSAADYASFIDNIMGANICLTDSSCDDFSCQNTYLIDSFANNLSVVIGSNGKHQVTLAPTLFHIGQVSFQTLYFTHNGAYGCNLGGFKFKQSYHEVVINLEYFISNSPCFSNC